MPIVKLSTGKRVRMLDEFGPAESLRTAELSEAPAQMSAADEILWSIASTMVATIEADLADGKGFQKPEALIGDNHATKDMLLAFRQHFDQVEWRQLDKAFAKLYSDPKAEKLADAFEIEEPANS